MPALYPIKRNKTTIGVVNSSRIEEVVLLNEVIKIGKVTKLVNLHHSSFKSRVIINTIGRKKNLTSSSCCVFRFPKASIAGRTQHYSSPTMSSSNSFLFYSLFRRPLSARQIFVALTRGSGRAFRGIDADTTFVIPSWLLSPSSYSSSPLSL